MTAARLAAACLVAMVAACGTPSDGAVDTAPGDSADGSQGDTRAGTAPGDRAPTGTATAPRGGEEPVADRGPILVLGDSLTVGAVQEGDLESSLEARGWDHEIVGRVGESITWALDEVRGRRTVPEVVVVELGTNPGPHPEDFARDLDELVSELRQRGASLVVWIPPDDGDDPGRARRADAVRDATASGMEVADWPVVLDRHPEYLAGDGIHLTETGYRRLASFIAQAVGTWPTTRSA